MLTPLGELVEVNGHNMSVYTEGDGDKTFTSFAELYKHLPLLKCGYNDDNINAASPDDMDIYYPKEKQNQYGVVGIEISLLSK